QLDLRVSPATPARRAGLAQEDAPTGSPRILARTASERGAAAGAGLGEGVGAGAATAATDRSSRAAATIHRLFITGSSKVGEDPPLRRCSRAFHRDFCD